MSSLRSNTPDPDDLSDSTLGTLLYTGFYPVMAISHRDIQFFSLVTACYLHSLSYHVNLSCDPSECKISGF